MAQNDQKAYFGPILADFGPNILIFRGVSKSFGTNITENHLDNLSALFFGQALDQMGQKCRYLAKNASFGPNLVVFGQKILFFTGEIKRVITHIMEKPPRHLVHIVFWSGIGQKVQKKAIFGPKCPKMQILDQIWPFFGQIS